MVLKYVKSDRKKLKKKYVQINIITVQQLIILVMLYTIFNCKYKNYMYLYIIGIHKRGKYLTLYFIFMYY